MNIKNPEAHRLASIHSKLTGETMTKAVTAALRERLAQETQRRDKGKMVDEILAIGRRCAALPER
jgi:antitoxin VapB